MFELQSPQILWVEAITGYEYEYEYDTINGWQKRFISHVKQLGFDQLWSKLDLEFN